MGPYTKKQAKKESIKLARIARWGRQNIPNSSLSETNVEFTVTTASQLYFQRSKLKSLPSQSCITPLPHGTATTSRPDDSSTKQAKWDDTNYRGRRIFACDSIQLFLSKLNNHFKSCKSVELSFTKEIKNFGGLDRHTVISCNCGYQFEIKSDTGIESLPINKATVWGCQVAPIGYEAIASFLTTLDLPVPSSSLFSKLQNVARVDITTALEKELLAAGAEERKLAEEAGDYINVGGNQYLKIIVAVDGGWSKRSYSHSYNANCGVAVIIGYRTQKVLFVGTRNKTCVICKRAENLGDTPKSHNCYKNFDKPSTAMEADAIAEGFGKSIQMHGLVYYKMIGDGDSSVHARVIDTYPGHKVQKIECINHAMRNFNRKLMNISSNNVKGKKADIPKEERQIEGMSGLFDRLGKGVRGAIDFHHTFCYEKDRWKQLDSDIMNVAKHVFGDHSQCQTYFCGPERKSEKNLVPEMCQKQFWNLMTEALKKLASMSESLILKMNTNCVESFMAVANRYMEGKRKHLGGSYLYDLRMRCAVFSFNTCGFWLADAYIHTHGIAPQSNWITLRDRAFREKNRTRSKPPPRVITYGFLRSKKGDEHYGTNPTRPDMTNEMLSFKIQQLYENLQVDELGQKLIEEKTQEQSMSDDWFEERGKRMTASKAGPICKLKETTDNTAMLNSILKHQKTRGTVAMQYGSEYEKTAILDYELASGFPEGHVKKCGLVVYLEDGIYAASPDGFVGEDGIIEVKCPYSIRDGKIEDWPGSSSDCPLKLLNGVLQLKTTHNHYYQIVQQLHITNRMWCDYVVWTPNDLFVQRIERNVETLAHWEAMKMKLKKFWFEDLAPELVDSRLQRNYKDYRCPVSRSVGRAKLLASREKRRAKNIGGSL
ncbi:Alkaline nuclease [Orchesella cincta]|uniref:Alkaline nuclease n=1 Tax=Orchesella cincta TaxID=48709 RepID=A0A1D2M4T5_ORCCI|nr:Alkaline nuclease [Orchesella cincta]